MKQSSEAKIYALEIKIKNMEAQAALFEQELDTLRQQLNQLKADTGYTEAGAKRALQREFEQELRQETPETPTTEEPPKLVKFPLFEESKEDLPEDHKEDKQEDKKEQEIPETPTPTESPKLIKFPLFSDEAPPENQKEDKQEEQKQEEYAETPTPVEELTPEPVLATTGADAHARRTTSRPQKAAEKSQSKQEPFDIENFIGGNVLSKLGILILIIGVGVFLKYAIDRNLISPLGRLILAYGAGAGLIGLSYYLKAKYHAYSAVLFSGGTATIYFTTYIGYVFLQVVPQGLAFPLMLLSTVYTVYQSTRFDEEIIGIIGLVGAYAIPPLIGNSGGNVAVFFTYICIINIGVLVLAFRKNWYRVDLTAFIVSWLIFIVWLGQAYQAPLYTIALVFSFAFFIIFQVTLVVHYTRQKDQHPEVKTVLLLLNAIVFYLVGTAIFQHNNIDFVQNHLFEGYKRVLLGQGLFTLAYSVLCLATAAYIANYDQDEASSQVYTPFTNIGIYTFSFALYLSLSGVWIPIAWALQTALLFVLWQLPHIKSDALEYAAKTLPVGVILITPLVFGDKTTYVIWAVEATILFAVSQQWKVEVYNAFTLLILTFIALYLPFEFHDGWLLFWWSVELAVVYTVARLKHDAQYDYLSLGLFVLLAIGIGLIYQDGQMLLMWTAEGLLVFALSRIFTERADLYEYLSVGLSLLVSYGIFTETEGQARIWWWLLESVVVFALGHFFKSTYLKYVNHLILVFSINDTLELWKDTYLNAKPFLGFMFNSSFLVSISLIGEILGLGYIYNQYANKSGEKLDVNIQYLIDFIGVILLYSLFFCEIVHYHIAQPPADQYLMAAVLLMYSFGYITALAGIAHWWLPRKLFGYGLIVLSALLVLLFVSTGFYSLHQLHLKQSYGWLRWGAYGLLATMLWVIYHMIRRHQLFEAQQKQGWFVISHVLAVMILSFELVTLSLLLGGLTMEQVRQSVFKLGFTLTWGIYSVILIAYGIAKRLKYLRLTGFVFLAITLAKLFSNDINYSSTLNVILAFISIGALLLITAFLYQKYKHIILADDEAEANE